MSRPSPYPSYPHHHPHHGRPFIVVHNNDVLSGRGVNIAQHPGNERFRALVNTRYDASYCTSFTTSEKRALAEEIVRHIRSLDPPGRFLKRSGRSQSSRGLNGPWEELSERECVKKALQALRDCNRPDRSGYAAQVSVPTDVKQSAEERTKSGMSLKEHAAAAVAKCNPSNLPPTAQHPQQPPLDINASILDHKFDGNGTDAGMYLSRKRSGEEISDAESSDRLSPSIENAAEWLKKQRGEDPLPIDHQATPVYSSSNEIGEPIDIHSTPTPHVAPVPVSTTPVSTHNYAQTGHCALDSSLVPQNNTSPHIHSPSHYHHHHQEHQEAATEAASVTAPYSPVALLTPQTTRESLVDHPSPHGLDDRHSDDDAAPHFAEHDYASHHEHQHQSFDAHFNPEPHHHVQPLDMLQSAADAAEVMMDNSVQQGAFALLGGDDVTHEALGICDL